MTSPRDAARPWPWWSLMALVAALVATFGGVAAIGARDAARGERVLAVLGPLVDLVNQTGQRLTLSVLADGATLAWAVTGICAALALSGLLIGRRRGSPLVLLGAAVSLTVWGQIQLFGSQPHRGVWLYALGMACAAGVGGWCPLTRLPGLPQLPEPADQANDTVRRVPARLPWGLEWVVVVLLAFAAVLTRTYALTELPHAYDLEMIDSVVMSRTMWSVGAYFRGGFMSNSAGIIHLLPGPLLFTLFGSSVYTVRLVAVLFGFAAIPLLYWLVRRLAGVGAATAAAVLMLSAPEQLYWSRIETGGFVPIAVLALITAHVGLSMIRRFSFGAMLGTALWMPFGRYGYAPAYVLVLYPLALYAHGLVCVRRVWRTLWYGLPLLASGLAVWSVSLSLVYAYVNGGGWRFIHPAYIFGAPLWRMHGQAGFRDAGFVELVQLQTITMTAKLGAVMAGFWYHGPGMLSQWFQRVCFQPDHVTVLNAGVAVMFALGLGYLLGQVYLRQAFALLVWAGLGLLPAIMSDEPTTRRLTVLFPAIYAIIGVTLAATVAIVRHCAGRWLAEVTGALLGLVLALVACSNLASHFLLRTGPTWLAPAIEFARPLLDGSDVILHNLESGIPKIMVLGDMDRFLAAPVCVQPVEDKEWMDAALNLPCNFDGEVYKLTVPPERREALQREYAPKRVSFLLEETPTSGSHIELLQQLFPTAAVRRGRFSEEQRSLFSLTVDQTEIQALHAPVLRREGGADDGPALERGLLEGVTLVRAASPPDAAPAAATVEGGIFVAQDGWYRFALRDGCPGATLTIDGRPDPASSAFPMLAGVHRFEITLPDLTACRLPLAVLIGAGADGAMTPIEPTRFLSPRVAELAERTRPVVVAYTGYGAVEAVAQWPGRGMALDVDGQGAAYVLVMDNEGWHVRRFDRQGREETRWPVRAEPGQFVSGMVVDRDGTAIVTGETQILVYDRDGKLLQTWKTPWEAQTNDIALVPDGRIMLAVPSRGALALFTRDGQFQGEVKDFAGGPGTLVRPDAVTIDSDGRMLVVQEDGYALVFQIQDDPLHPAFVGEFRPDFVHLPLSARGGAFDGPDRILIPDPSTTTPLVYNPSGERLVAAVPERDLSDKRLGQVVKFVPTAARLYALENNRIWSIAR